jgi:hypothetical protein
MNRRRDRTWTRVATVLVWAAVATACSALRVCPVRRAAPVEMYDLMLDLSVLPDGWKVCAGPGPIPKRERGETEALLVGFCPPDFEGIGGTHQEIYRYGNELVAASVYNREFQAREFPKHNMIVPWAVPEEWSYQSPVADHFKFACGETGSPHQVTVCAAVARYDEYVSVLVTHPIPDNITLEQVEGLLIAIDERMEFYLRKDTE